MLFHFAVKDIVNKLAGGLRFTENDGRIVPCHPGGQAGSQCRRSHFAAILAAISFFPRCLFHKDISFGVAGLGAFKFAGKAGTVGAKVAADFGKGLFALNRNLISKGICNAAGEHALSGVITKVQFGCKNRAAHLLNALGKRWGFVLAGIDQDGERFKSGFDKDWFDNIIPLGEKPPIPAEGDGRENEFEAGITG